MCIFVALTSIKSKSAPRYIVHQNRSTECNQTMNPYIMRIWVGRIESLYNKQQLARKIDGVL